MGVSNAVRTPKIAEAIAAHLRRLILEGALRPGERLAAERELAGKLEVSRPSLREAIDKLAADGLLITGRGGTYVAEFTRSLTDPLVSLLRDGNDNNRITLDYYEFREPLEARAAALAADRATSVEREAIGACVERMRHAHELESPTEEANADADLHVLIFEATHNLVLLHVMRAFSALLRENILFVREQFYLRPGIRDALLAQHVAIAEAVIAADAAEAEIQAAAHVRFHIENFEQIRDETVRLDAALRRVGRGELLAG